MVNIKRAITHALLVYSVKTCTMMKQISLKIFEMPSVVTGMAPLIDL